MRALLEVQAPGADRRLRDQHAHVAAHEAKERLLFRFVGVGAADLHGVRDQLGEEVTLDVQVTPGERRFAGLVHESRDRLTRSSIVRRRSARCSDSPTAGMVKSIPGAGLADLIRCSVSTSAAARTRHWLHPRSEGIRTARAHEQTQRQNACCACPLNRHRDAPAFESYWWRRPKAKGRIESESLLKNRVSMSV